MKLVNTDNFYKDYSHEFFINLPPLSETTLNIIAYIINEECSGPRAERYWKVVEDDYELETRMEDELRNK